MTDKNASIKIIRLFTLNLHVNVIQLKHIKLRCMSRGQTVVPDPCGSCKDVLFDKFTSFLSVFSVYCVYFQQSIQSFILRGLKYELLNNA